MTIEKYFCDICEKEVAKEELKCVGIPCHGDDGEGRMSGYDIIYLDLCDECKKDYMIRYSIILPKFITTLMDIGL